MSWVNRGTDEGEDWHDAGLPLCRVINRMEALLRKHGVNTAGARGAEGLLDLVEQLVERLAKPA